MAEQEKSSQAVHAPYNFVGFPKKLLVDSADNAMRHDQLDPALKSGEIRITLTAETPVFVSDGNKDDPHFFRTPGGIFALPGSTVRGLVRENMQILSFAPVRPNEDFENIQIYFRQMAGRNDNNREDLKKEYKQVLNIVTEPKKNFSYSENTSTRKRNANISVPKNVKSGWIRCENGNYFIYRTRKNYLRVSRMHSDVQQFQKTFPELKGEERRKAEDKANNARTIPIAYTDDGRGKVKEICPLEQARPGMKRGALLYTGKPVGRVPNGLYIFPEADYSTRPERFSKDDELSYREDWENRRNNLNAYYDPDFWKLPEEGQTKPVFYIRFEGHTYCGMSLFLRIGYRYPLSKGLPCEWDDSVMDYPHAILGYASRERSQRSRVSFSDCTICGNAQEMAPVSMILASPKPSYYAGYVNPVNNKANHYSNDNFELRGFKQYWLKEPVETSVELGKEKVGTKLRPLPVGTRFTGVVRFKNLTPAELGLLLWSLRLEEGCYQTVGMGKPYGYGRMKLTIDSLTEYSIDNLYSGDLCAPACVALTGSACDKKVEECVQQFNQEATSQLAASATSRRKKGRQKEPQTFQERGPIRDFFWMKSQVQSGEEYNYMQLERYKEIDAPLHEAGTLRREAERKAK